MEKTLQITKCKLLNIILEKWIDGKLNKSFLHFLHLYGIVTRRFFYMKTVKIKVIQNFMEITFYIKTYSKRTCWKKFFKFKFWLFFVDIWRRIRLQAMATRQQPPTNQNKNIVSKIETENKMLNNIFQQVFSEKQLKQRVISIKFWITFIINVFL